MEPTLRWGALELAGSYAQLLAPELLAREVPPVPTVECVRCRRVEEGTADPGTKCCDIVPRLPSFLVGEILESGGHPIVEAWIAERRGDPFGIQVPPVLAEEHARARSPGRFGKPCPLLRDGACSIYGRRPPNCVDYHCYYPDMFLREAFACLSTTLMAVQREAEKRLVMSSDLDHREIAAALLHEQPWIGYAQAPANYRRLWQHHAGKETAFYRWAYRTVKDFAPPPPITSRRPTDALREAFRGGAIPAHRNEVGPLEQQQLLLWYLERLASGRPRLTVVT